MTAPCPASGREQQDRAEDDGKNNRASEPEASSEEEAPLEATFGRSASPLPTPEDGKTDRGDSET